MSWDKKTSLDKKEKNSKRRKEKEWGGEAHFCALLSAHQTFFLSMLRK